MNTDKAKICYFIRIYRRLFAVKKSRAPFGPRLKLRQKNRGPSREGPRNYANLSVNAPHESEIMHHHQLKVIASSMQKNIRNAAPGCQSFSQRNWRGKYSPSQTFRQPCGLEPEFCQPGRGQPISPLRPDRAISSAYNKPRGWHIFIPHKESGGNKVCDNIYHFVIKFLNKTTK